MVGSLPLAFASRLATASGGRLGWLTPPDKSGPSQVSRRFLGEFLAAVSFGRIPSAVGVAAVASQVLIWNKTATSFSVSCSWPRKDSQATSSTIAPIQEKPVMAISVRPATLAQRLLPILGWLPSYRREWLLPDILASVAVWA